MTYKIEYEKYPWECECCGSGYHERVTLYKDSVVEYTWSINDQFGGTLQDDDYAFPNSYGDAESFACGLYNGISISGHSVFVEVHQ